MEILNKIAEIKNYKSYSDFSWNNLSKYLNKKGNEIDAEFDSGFNIIFGENGSGKSAVVQILKSLSQNGNFIETYPEKVILQFKETEYIYENHKWKDDNLLDKTDIVIFDTDFISTNIHTNGCRETAIDKGGHTQNSGKLLIEFDSEALRLKGVYETANEELKNYKQKNQSDLEFTLSEDEEIIYKELKYKNNDEIKVIKKTIPKKISNLDDEIEQLNKNKLQINDIQAIDEIDSIDELDSLPEKQTIHELFLRDLKEKSSEMASTEILKKLTDYEEFYKDHKDLKESDTCPFCGYILNTDQAKQMLKIYQSYFDYTYESNLKQFRQDISDQLTILKSVKKTTDSIPAYILEKQKSFNELSKNYSTLKFKDIPETSTMSTTSLDLLIKDIQKLQEGKKPLFSEENYNKISDVYSKCVSVVDSLNKWIEDNNNIIGNFKKINKSEADIDDIISSKTRMKNMLSLTQEMLSENKINKFQKAETARVQKKSLENTINLAKIDYQEYLEKLPKSTADKMQGIVNKEFNLNFKLEVEPVQIGRAKEYPFKFKVVDSDGHERSINDGLSEGERQIISFAFFFAHLDNLPKQKRIIIFDDPVNSVDSKNLKVFVDLIHSECKGNQVFIFTHHSLFFKYSSKTLSGSSFGIVKNKDKFGGSFIYREKPLIIEDKLTQMDESLKKLIQQGEMNYTIFTMEYGHLLRYSVENFIKSKLLCWDKEFTQVIDSIGKHKLEEDDLKAIRKIYDFCNWSNHLHPDKEEPASLDELKIYIDKFLEIRKTVA